MVNMFSVVEFFIDVRTNADPARNSAFLPINLSKAVKESVWTMAQVTAYRFIYCSTHFLEASDVQNSR